MSVLLRLSCNGCFVTAEGTGPLQMRFHGTHGDHGFGVARIDDPQDLAPEGWMMFDPYTYATYCPKCWAEIASPEPEGGAGMNLTEFTVSLRSDESPMEAARRNAIDAVYFARDRGGTMHDAGELAAKAAIEAYESLRRCEKCGHSRAAIVWGDVQPGGDE